MSARGAWRRVAIVVLAAHANAQSVGLDAAVNEARAGRLGAALRAAESDPDPLRRAQAMVYVLAKAGDLSGALRSAREGLTIRSDDLWLLERTCSLGVAMHLGTEARESLERMAQALDRTVLDPSERERWNATVAAYASAVAELSELSAEQARAKHRARSTVLVAGLTVLSGLCWLALTAQKKPPQRSVDSQGRPSSPGFS